MNKNLNDILQKVSEMFFDLWNQKPDVIFLGGIFLGYFVVYFLSKTLKKNPSKVLASKKGVKQNSKYRNSSFVPQKTFEPKLRWYDYTLPLLIEVIQTLKIKRKLEKGESSHLTFSQALALIQNPNYSFYVSEYNKILYEKLKKDREIILDPNENKLPKVEHKNKVIDLSDGAKVIIDENGLIQKTILPEDENKKIASEIDKKIKEGIFDDEIENQESNENKLEEEKIFSAKEQEEKKLEEVALKFFGDSFSSPAEKKLETSDEKDEEVLNAAEYKKRLKEKNKKEKKQNKKTEIVDLETFTQEIFSGVDIESERKQIKESFDATPEEERQIKKTDQNQKEKKIHFDQNENPSSNSGVINFLKAEVLKTDLDEQVFLLEDKLAIDQKFFEKFHNGNSILDSNAFKTIVRSIEKKYEISIQINKRIDFISPERWFSVIFLEEEQKDEVNIFYKSLKNNH